MINKASLALLSLLVPCVAAGAVDPVFDACRISAGADLIDFESQPIGATPSPATIDGVSFAADALGIVSLAPFGANGTEVEDNSIVTLNSGTITSGPYVPMTLSFTEPVAQVGFGIWDLNFQGNALAAFDSDGGLLGSLVVPNDLLGPPGGGTAAFIGFVSDTPDIASVVFTPVSTGEFYAIDNVLFTSEIPAPDADGDCVPDFADNCVLAANFDQRDSDGDNLGNACDADIFQPNDCLVNFADLGTLKDAFFARPADANWNPDGDFNGDEVINFGDLGIMKDAFFGPPGPSGLANACTPPEA